jgi:hypothetical protein
MEANIITDVYDRNKKPLRNGDVIDICQTVNGQNLFIVFGSSLLNLDIRYEHDITRRYEYNKSELVSKNKFSGETEFVILSNIFSDVAYFAQCIYVRNNKNSFCREYNIELKETEVDKKINKTIVEQDQIIGRQLREITQLNNDLYKSKERIREMKKEAGYDDSISFDIVWKEILEKSRK